MQFIIGHQGRLTASVQKHDEQIAKLEKSVATVTDSVGGLARAEIRLVERMDAPAQRTDTLAERPDGKETRLQSPETKWTQFLERMDRFIQGLEGNGHQSP